MEQPPSSLRKIFNTVQTTMQRQGNSTFYGATLQRQQSLKSGWLKKQGGVVKSWHRRWFVLKGDQLFYFSSEDETKAPLGSIFLPGNRVMEHPMIPGEPEKFLFEILPGGDRNKMSSNHDSYPLWAMSDDERKSWVMIIRKVMYYDRGGGIFGQPLEETMNYEKRVGTRKVPEVVEMCVEFIMQNGLDVEGLFRLPGRTSLVRDLREEFDCGERPQFILPDVDIHTVASLLKQFLRDLPEPIIPKEFYESVMKTVTRDMHIEPDVALERLCKLLTHIPAVNYNLLQYICQFLREVTQHEDVNKMTAMNLATIFMHAFIRPDLDDPALLMGTAQGRTQVAFIMISQSEKVFSMEYTQEGQSVHVDKLLDLDNGTEQSPAPFNPDSRYRVQSLTKDNRVSELLDLNFVQEEPGYSLPLPLAPQTPTRKDENEHLYQTPYDAINVPKAATLERSENVEESSPVYAEISSPKSNVKRSNSLPSPPPRPHRLSRPSQSLSFDSIASIDCASISADEEEEEAVTALIAMDLSQFSSEDLHTHIETLCTELRDQRSKVRALRINLRTVKSKYKQKVQEMAEKRNEDRAATAGAVDKIIKLQKELQGYKMKYGNMEGK